MEGKSRSDFDDLDLTCILKVKLALLNVQNRVSMHYPLNLWMFFTKLAWINFGKRVRVDYIR